MKRTSTLAYGGLVLMRFLASGVVALAFLFMASSSFASSVDVPECGPSSPFECGLDEVCVDDKCVRGECADDAKCGTGKFCFAHTCFEDKCASDPKCHPIEVCSKFNGCELRKCRIAADCDTVSGTFCGKLDPNDRDRSCVECTEDTNCPSPPSGSRAVCDGGKCKFEPQPLCTDTNCPMPSDDPRAIFCDPSIGCVICRNPNDCPPGQTCNTGMCEDVPPPLTCDGEPVTIKGTSSDDFLPGTENKDVIDGLGGNDVIIGFGGDDTICGGDDNDILIGGNGDDKLFGGDSLKGGNDALFGQIGDDTLNGGQDVRDFCDGGIGNNMLMNCEIP